MRSHHAKQGLAAPGRDARSTAHNRRIVQAHDRAYWVVQAFWTSRTNLATHVGYWEPHIRTDHEAQANLNRVLAERVGVRHDDRVLDAGFGLGGTTFWLAETYGTEVVGITLSEGRVRHARKRAKRRGLADRTSFEAQDHSHTTFADASFDVVFAIESACYALQSQDFLDEAFRVLRPGGRLAVADGFRRERPLDPQAEEVVRRWLDGWTVPDLDTCDEFLTSAQAAGFVDVRFDDVTEHVLPSLRRARRLARWVLPPARALRSIRVLPETVVDGIDSAEVCYGIVQRREVSYGIVSMRKPDRVPERAR